MKAKALKEWLLVVGIVSMSIAVTLGVIRWVAPQLLGIRSDLQFVQLSEKLPAFYDNVFREQDHRSKDFILHDPIVGMRARPLLAEGDGVGPHDILVFR